MMVINSLNNVGFTSVGEPRLSSSDSRRWRLRLCIMDGLINCQDTKNRHADSVQDQQATVRVGLVNVRV